MLAFGGSLCSLSTFLDRVMSIYVRQFYTHARVFPFPTSCDIPSCSSRQRVNDDDVRRIGDESRMTNRWWSCTWNSAQRSGPCLQCMVLRMNRLGSSWTDHAPPTVADSPILPISTL